MVAGTLVGDGYCLVLGLAVLLGWTRNFQKCYQDLHNTPPRLVEASMHSFLCSQAFLQQNRQQWLHSWGWVNLCTSTRFGYKTHKFEEPRNTGSDPCDGRRQDKKPVRPATKYLCVSASELSMALTELAFVRTLMNGIRSFVQGPNKYS